MLQFTENSLSFFQTLNNTDKINFMDAAMEGDDVAAPLTKLTKLYVDDLLMIYNVGDNVQVLIEMYESDMGELIKLMTVTEKDLNSIHYIVTSNKLNAVNYFLKSQFESGTMVSCNKQLTNVIKKNKSKMNFLNLRYVRWYTQFNEGYDYLCYN